MWEKMESKNLSKTNRKNFTILGGDMCSQGHLGILDSASGHY